MDPTAKPTAIGPPFEGQIKIVAELPPGLNKYSSDSDDLDASTTKTTTLTTSTSKSTTTTALPITNGTSTPNHVESLTITSSSEKGKSTSSPTLDMNLDLRVDIYEAAAKSYEAKKNLKKCSSCEKEVKEGYQHESTFICNTCYDTDKLPENKLKSDYKKTEQESSLLEKTWTEQEELLLLEGLEMFPTDWDQIADHVSTQTRDSCILHYLKLPTADPRIDPEIKKLGLLSFNQNDQIDNPIMSVVAFLAANVKPKVAASSIFQAATIDEEDNDSDGKMVEVEETDRLESTYNLIRAKISQFSSRVQDFEQMESLVDEQRRQLDREKFLVREDHLSIRNQMDNIYQTMFQRRQAKLLQEQQKRMLEIQQQQLAQQQQAQQQAQQQEQQQAQHQAQQQAQQQMPPPPQQVQQHMQQAQQVQQQHIAQLQQQQYHSTQQTEELMPNNVIIKLSNDPMTPEEREFQSRLRARYPGQYLERQHEIAASRQAAAAVAVIATTNGISPSPPPISNPPQQH
jgi:hypothetical protein